jgi:hypothetical protein
MTLNRPWAARTVALCRGLRRGAKAIAGCGVGFGRIVVSVIEAPIILANLV